MMRISTFQWRVARRLGSHAAIVLALVAGMSGSVQGAVPAAAESEDTLSCPVVPPELSDAISQVEFDALTPQFRATLNRLAAHIAQGRPMPATCFAPDTPNAVVEAFERSFHKFGQQGFGPRYEPGPRWEETALDPTSTGEWGKRTTLTFSFVPDGTMLPEGGAGDSDAPSDLMEILDARYGSRDTWVNLYKAMFDRWSKVTGITYVYEPNDDGAPFIDSPGVPGVRGDLRLSGKPIDGNSGVLAYNYFPQVGDMVLDTADNFFDTLDNDSLRLRNVLWHEHGHGQGLFHTCPIARLKLMEPFVATNFEGPQVDDIRGSQRMYGDPNEPNNSGPTATNAGSLGIATPLVIGDPGTAKLGSTVGLHDSTDVDWYRVTILDSGVVSFRLRPAGYEYDARGQNCPGESGSCCYGGPENATTLLDLGMEIRRGISGSVIAMGAGAAAGVDEFVNGVKVSAGDVIAIRVFAEFTPGAEECQLYTIDLVETVPALVVAPAEQLPTLVRVGSPMRIRAQIGPGSQIYAAGSAKVFYRLKGQTAFNSVLMTLDAGDVYTALVPMGTCGQVTEYYIQAQSQSGTFVRSPEDAPTSFYTAKSGNPFGVEIFQDSFNTNKNWTESHAALPADAPAGSVFDGGWERGTMQGHGQRFDPSYDADDNGWAALTADRIGNSDVDWGPTWWTSPAFNLNGYAAATLNFSRWVRNSIVDGDVLTVEFSSDNGTHWTVAKSFGDDIRGWVKESIRIDDYVPLTAVVRIRFGAVDVPNNSSLECGIDDVHLLTHDCSTTCPCPADADGSGGTPDVTDIDAFFTNWLLGDPSADADCSGGTPDVTDIDVFFTTWLAGGC